MQFILLDPRPAALPAQQDLIAGRRTLGIEVTVPELARSCVLNIDPQHDNSDSDEAAIDVIMRHAEELADFDILATVRPDLDSVGAMAVLLNYSRGVRVDRAARQKIELISAYDRFEHGAWHPGIRPPVDWGVRALNRRISDPRLSLADRVELMADWLRGEVDLSSEAVEAERYAQVAADASRIEVRGRIAIVISTVPSRTPIELGYEQAPIVILSNPAARVNGGEPHQKYSVCVWPGSGALDLAGALALLQQWEPGWGGNVAGGIIGSPQGIGSQLNIENVYDIVSRFGC